MRAIHLFSLSILLFLTGSGDCWRFTNLNASSFEKIFPYSQKADVQELVDKLNELKDVEISPTWKWELMGFAKLHMNLPSSRTQKLKTDNYTDPSDAVYLNQVTSQQAVLLEISYRFIRHRITIDRYIRYLFRSFLIFDYFDHKQAQTMRSIFWAADEHCGDDFECTESEFFDKFGEQFSAHFDYVKVDLNLLCNAVRKFPTISEYLYWTIPSDF